MFSRNLKSDTSLAFFLISFTQRDKVICIALYLYTQTCRHFFVPENSMMHIIKKSSANFHIFFITASHWTISPASLIHSTSSHIISVRPLILIVTRPIIYLVTYSISAKSGTKTRPRKPAISPVVTSVRESTATIGV